MEGPGETVSSNNFAPIANKVVPPQSSCKYLYKSHLYVRLNRSNRCISLCEGDVLFNTHEKVRKFCHLIPIKSKFSCVSATRMVLDGSVECCGLIYSCHCLTVPYLNRRKFRALTSRRVSLFNLRWVRNQNFSGKKFLELRLRCVFPGSFTSIN